MIPAAMNVPPRLISIFVFWWLSIVCIGLIGERFIPDNTFQIAHLFSRLPQLLDPWVKWDGVWFYEISQYGYQRVGLTAFFPLYPITVQLVSRLLPVVHPALIAILIATLAFFCSIVVVYHLARFDLDRQEALMVCVYLLLFPTSFFAIMPYSESFFFLFSVLAFYAARREKWLWTGVTGGLAALSRPVGVLLLIPLCIEFLASKKRSTDRNSRHYPIVYLLLIPTGLLLYIGFVLSAFSDPFAFIRVQQEWGRFSSDPLQALIRSLSLIKGAYYVFFLAGAIAVSRLLRISYGIYMFCILLIPIITGSTMSMNRHLGLLFPVFFLLARFLRGRLFLSCLVACIFSIALIYLLLRYVNGYWAG